jgi:hypothetical protein
MTQQLWVTATAAAGRGLERVTVTDKAGRTALTDVGWFG